MFECLNAKWRYYGGSVWSEVATVRSQPVMSGSVAPGLPRLLLSATQGRSLITKKAAHWVLKIINQATKSKVAMEGLSFY